MATKDRVTIELYVDDQGTVKIRNATVATQELAAASVSGSQASMAGADDFAASLMKQIGIYALVTAAAYKVGDAVLSSFKAGIQAVDDFQLTTIGVAATLTDLAKDQGKGQENFNQALAYSKGMYNELELAAARYFASGKEMTQAWNILAQKGIVLKHDEIDALGIIVDRIKLSTQGQVASLQIAQELRSMITGQARATDQVGMLLKDRIPNLEAELQKHRQIGDVVTWLASQFKGLEFGSAKIQETLESQKSTLDTLLTQVGRGGLTGAYEDIVNLLKRVNEYLTTHKDDLAVGIAKGWATIAWTVGKVKDALSWMIDHAPAIQAATAAGKYGQAAQATPPVDRTFGQQAMVTYKDAFWAAPGDLADKTASGISKAWDFAAEGVQGWMMVIQEAYSLADKADDAFYKKLRETSDFIGNSEFWKWAIDTEGPKKEIDQVKDKLQSVIDLVSRTYSFVINAVVTGLPSWFGGGGPAPGTMPEKKLTVPDTSLAAAQEQARLKALGKFQIMSPDFGMLELPEWAMQSSKPAATKTGAGKEAKGGGGKGRDTTDSLENLILQLRQEEAKLTEGAFAGVEAWYDKIVAKVKKLAMDDEQLKDGMLAASELKAAKEQKISDDQRKWYLGQMHQTTAAQIVEDQKKLELVKGHVKEEDQAREVMAQHALDRAAKLALAENQQQKTYYDSLASSSILIADQVAWKEQSWQMEKKISQAQLEQWFIGKDITESRKDDYRSMLALTNAAKDYNQQRQKAVDLGTLEGWAIERAGEAQKRSISFIKDTMAGAESYLGDVGGTAFVNAIRGGKTDLSKVFSDLADSFIKQIWKAGVNKAFDFLGEAFGGGKPGTKGNPLYVTFDGAGLGAKAGLGSGGIDIAEKKAQKIGYSMGGDQSWEEQTAKLKIYDKMLDNMYKDQRRDILSIDKLETKDAKDDKKQLGGMIKLEQNYYKDLRADATWYTKAQDKMIDKNQELFKADYINEYQASFEGMVGNITSVWQLGQGLMTAAGVSGETARYASMASYGMQALSLLWTLITKGVLMKAAMAGASAFSSVWENVGFPLALVLAPAMAVVAFGGTLAAGMLGGGGGGGGGGRPGLAASPGMQSTGGGYTEGYHTGGLVAHSGLLVAHGGLANDERLVKVLTGEPILQRSAMDTYRRMGMSFDDLNNGRLPVAALPVPVGGGDSGGNGGPIIQHHTTTHITVVTPDGKVISKQTKREIINLMKDKDVQREIRVRAH